jgi:hypothetical protein
MSLCFIHVRRHYYAESHEPLEISSFLLQQPRRPHHQVQSLVPWESYPFHFQRAHTMPLNRLQ